jgi:hypothetical protein
MRTSTLFLSVLLCGTLAAQVPQAFDFQAVARNASGNVLSAQPVSVRLSIHSGTAGGAIAYQETHAVTTSALGLFSVAVGQGSTVLGVFADVAWGETAHFLHVELDATGGSNYVDMGTTQLLSVPYALHAGSVACPTVSLLGDTVRYGNGCYLIQPGMSAANGGCLDLDNDGFYNNAGCPPLDCNDADALVNPGTAEICGNGTDDDCDGAVDNNIDPLSFVLFYVDVDGDGFGDAAITSSACTQPTGFVTNDGDCDDSDPAIFPGQNCSEFCTPAESAWVNANFSDYRDALMNAFSNCVLTNNPNACIQGILAQSGFPLSDDCNSCGVTWALCVRTNCLNACLQGQAACEACMNTAGCNAGLMQCFGLTDTDGDGWPAGSDCNDNNAAIHPGATEVCDTLDNDCDGAVDEGNVCNLCPDDDADGFTTCDGDCDDSNLNNNPGAVEVCDGVDNNCDGQIDENCELCNGIDDNGNGQVDEGLDLGAACGCGGVVICDGNGGTTCSVPMVAEVCADGIDNNCNGVVDEGCAGTECGFFNGTQQGTCGNGSICVNGFCVDCTDNDADGFTTCQGDCDDNNLNTNPAAVEVCNGIDDNCDGQVDEGCAPETCNGVDDDGDGLTDAADPSLVLVLCENQTGVCNGAQKSSNLCVGGMWLTCAASDYAIGSPVYEITETTCDTQDNDCDGQVDEGNVCCTDNDADGFTTCQGDCNDSNLNINPARPELCNGVDDDCDGQVDEGGVCP